MYDGVEFDDYPGNIGLRFMANCLFRPRFPYLALRP